MAIVEGNDKTNISALVDVNPEKLNEYNEKGIETFNSLDAFFGSGLKTDVVSICTPNGLHCQQAISAIEHGHHVLIEKPMGLTKKECEQVVSASLSYNKSVFVVKQNRYTPPIAWLKNIISNKKMGEIFHVKIDCFWNRDNRYYLPKGWRGTKEFDGGVLFTQFSHFIDIMYWVFGDIKNINTKLSNHNHNFSTEFADSGISYFDFEKEGNGTINFSTSVFDKNLESSITVIGEKGSVKIGGQYMNEVEYCHIKDYEMPVLPVSNAPNNYGPFQGSAANHHFVFENVVETLSGNATISTNAMEGMKVVDIIERMYNASPLF